MKISEMEAQLKELREKHGDLPVYIYKYPDDLHFEAEPFMIEYRPQEDIGDEPDDIWEHEGIYVG